MSHTTRRKHVLKEMMEDDFELPKEEQQIVRVIGSRGNNLHEVETANTNETEHFLVSMPTKFRKNVWVKRGDYILVEPIEEGDKVKAEICKILTPEHIKEYTKAGIWPERFAKKREEQPAQVRTTAGSFETDEESDSDDLLTPNTNRPALNENDDSDEEEDDDDDDESDED